MKARTKIMLHALGMVLSIAGVGFVVVTLAQGWTDSALRRLSLSSWGMIGALVLAYALACLLLAGAWRHLLATWSLMLSYRDALGIYGISQLGKYVPGNIMQFASRQSIGMSEGWPALPLAKSVFWEIALLVSAAAALAPLALPLIAPGIPGWVGIVGCMIVGLLAVACLGRWQGVSMARAFGYDTAFLVCAALVFVGVLAVCAPLHAMTVSWSATVLGAYVLAWVAGLLTPGAPAGLGVREFCLVALLGQTLPKAAILDAVAIGRLVTSAGDVVFFIYACALRAGSRR